MDRSDGGGPGAERRRRQARDAVLVHAVRQGDTWAFGRLYDEWFDHVFDVAARLLRHRGPATEVVAQTFDEAWRLLPVLDPSEALGGWLLRLARRGALDRDPHAVPGRFGDECATATPGGAVLADDDVDALVWAAAGTLPARQLGVLDLHRRHGLAPAEAAVALGLAPRAGAPLVAGAGRQLAAATVAVVLWNGGRPGCDALAARLRRHHRERPDVRIVRLIGRHAAGCATCGQRRELAVDPIELFAALPLVRVTRGERIALVEALVGAGLPLQGSRHAAARVATAPEAPPGVRRALGAAAGPLLLDPAPPAEDLPVAEPGTVCGDEPFVPGVHEVHRRPVIAGAAPPALARWRPAEPASLVSAGGRHVVRRRAPARRPTRARSAGRRRRPPVGHLKVPLPTQLKDLVGPYAVAVAAGAAGIFLVGAYVVDRPGRADRTDAHLDTGGTTPGPAPGAVAGEQGDVPAADPPAPDTAATPPASQDGSVEVSPATPPPVAPPDPVPPVVPTAPEPAPAAGPVLPGFPPGPVAGRSPAAPANPTPAAPAPAAPTPPPPPPLIRHFSVVPARMTAPWFTQAAPTLTWEVDRVPGGRVTVRGLPGGPVTSPTGRKVERTAVCPVAVIILFCNPTPASYRFLLTVEGPDGRELDSRVITLEVRPPPSPAAPGPPAPVPPGTAPAPAGP